MGETEAAEQLELIRSRLPRAPRRPSPEAAAAIDPVASVYVDTGLPHLDRPFEYSVPDSLVETAQPGVRVRCASPARTSTDSSSSAGPRPSTRVGWLAAPGGLARAGAGPEPAGRRACHGAAVCRDARRRPAARRPAPARRRREGPARGGALRPRAPGADVLRVESVCRGAPSCPTSPPAGRRPPRGWRLPRRTPRLAGPPRWPRRHAPRSGAAAARSSSCRTTVTSPGRRRPDHTARSGQARPAHRRPGAAGALHRLAQGAAWACAGGGRHPRCGVCAGAGPRAGVVVGRRRRPARRAAGALPPRAGGARGPGASRGRRAARRWLRPHGRHPGVGRQRRAEADRRAPRHRACCGPRVLVAGEGAELERDPAAASAHLPSIAWRTAKRPGTGTGARAGAPPRVPPSLSCQTCRAPARCAQCHGPLALPAPGAAPSCRWCGTAGGLRVRAVRRPPLRSAVVGARRTAEELGRAFPGVPVHTSGSGEVLDRVAGTPSLVIATPGAEPVADGGYAAVLLLDAWASLDRPALTAGESRSGAGWAPPRWPGGCRARRGRPLRRAGPHDDPGCGDAGPLGPGLVRRA